MSKKIGCVENADEIMNNGYGQQDVPVICPFAKGQIWFAINFTYGGARKGRWVMILNPYVGNGKIMVLPISRSNMETSMPIDLGRNTISYIQIGEPRKVPFSDLMNYFGVVPPEYLEKIFQAFEFVMHNEGEMPDELKEANEKWLKKCHNEDSEFFVKGNYATNYGSRESIALIKKLRDSLPGTQPDMRVMQLANIFANGERIKKGIAIPIGGPGAFLNSTYSDYTSSNHLIEDEEEYEISEQMPPTMAKEKNKPIIPPIKRNPTTNTRARKKGKLTVRSNYLTENEIRALLEMSSDRISKIYGVSLKRIYSVRYDFNRTYQDCDIKNIINPDTNIPVEVIQMLSEQMKSQNRKPDLTNCSDEEIRAIQKLCANIHQNTYTKNIGAFSSIRALDIIIKALDRYWAN